MSDLIIFLYLLQLSSNLSASLSYYPIISYVRTVRYVQCVHLYSEQCSGHGRRRRSKSGERSSDDDDDDVVHV